MRLGSRDDRDLVSAMSGKIKHGLRQVANTDYRYKLYMNIHNRCYNPNATDFEHYGGRGIFVAVEWHRDNPEGLSNFIRDIGDKPANPDGETGRYWSLDRIDNDGPYGPNNWRWATSSQQRRNRRDSTDLCPMGHLFDKANTAFDKNGWRRCRACGRIRTRAVRAKARAL